MPLLHIAIRKAFPRLNQKAHGFEDVERIARRHNISLTIADYGDDIFGYYCTRTRGNLRKKFIVINSKLDPIARVYTGLHELAHYFLHVPVSSQQWFYCRKNAELTDRKQEHEADTLALVAMIPLPLLAELNATSYTDIPPELLPYCIRRRQLWEARGI